MYVQGEVNLFLSTDANEAVPRLHPDGDLLMYQTDSSGNFEVVVRTFPDVTQGYFPITINGGFLAKWDPTGEWIYFMTEDEKLWRVSFERVSAVGSNETPTVRVGEPEFLLDVTYFGDVYSHPYDIGRVSGRIVVNIPVRTPGPEKLVVVQNWEAEEN